MYCYLSHKYLFFNGFKYFGNDNNYTFSDSIYLAQDRGFYRQLTDKQTHNRVGTILDMAIESFSKAKESTFIYGVTQPCNLRKYD